MEQNKIKYSISNEEQETVIIIRRAEDTAYISTSDSTMKTKLNKLCETSDKYKLTRTDGEYENFYEVADKSLISFRTKKREMSEEQKAMSSERLKKMIADGKLKRGKE